MTWAPPLRTRTSSATAITSDIECDTYTIGIPSSSRTCFRYLRISPLKARSRDEMGSSSSRSRGDAARALANATRWRSPPDSSETSRPIRSSSCNRPTTLSMDTVRPASGVRRCP